MICVVKPRTIHSESAPGPAGMSHVSGDFAERTDGYYYYDYDYYYYYYEGVLLLSVTLFFTAIPMFSRCSLDVAPGPP